MKLKSLILGSVAAAGLTTGAFAADLGVLTSLDVCDSLGISGLTLSSDTNCLQISGGVNYEMNWGDYRNETGGLQLITDVPFDVADFIESGGNANGNMDWQSKVEAWITAVASADSDFGPTRAIITMKYNDHPRYRNEAYNDNDGEFNPGPGAFGKEVPAYFDEAYVAVGDSTIIMAGKRKDGVGGSVANLDDDNSYNFLGSFIEQGVDGGGVLLDGDSDRLGGDVIQVQSDLGNGVNVGVGLENIDADETAAFQAGTLVGVVSYAGEGITAHVTGLAGGVLDGDVDTWAIHAGATGTFDMFNIRAALAYQHADFTTDDFGGRVAIDNDLFHALVTGSATFDIFTIALTGEYASEENNDLDLRDEGYGIGGSIGAKVTDGVAINLGARYFNGDNNLSSTIGEEEAVQIAAQLVASLTETITATGEVGVFFNEDRDNFEGGGTELDDGLYYGSAQLAWTPGGGFSTSVRGQVASNGAYRVTYKAAKTFE